MKFLIHNASYPFESNPEYLAAITKLDFVSTETDKYGRKCIYADISDLKQFEQITEAATDYYKNYYEEHKDDEKDEFEADWINDDLDGPKIVSSILIDLGRNDLTIVDDYLD